MRPAVFTRFLFLFLLAHTAEAQQLPRGTFSLSTGFEFQQFTFKGKNRFEYRFSSCTGGSKGSGKYKLKDSLLVLTFEDLPGKDPLEPVINVRPGPGDTALLDFTFLEAKEKWPVPNVVVKYSSRSTGAAYGSVSNDSGFLKLGIPRIDLPVEIEISTIGSSPRPISISGPGIYTIHYPVAFDFLKTYRRGDTLEFVVSSYAGDRIVLKRPGYERYDVHLRK